jgi:hypothetical protein
MNEKEINYPTSIQVFKNGFKFGNLCITKMNCILNISNRRIELDVKYHYEKNNYNYSNCINNLYILEEESENTFEEVLLLFGNIVKEAENLCTTKAIELKDVNMDGDIALCTIKETFEQCFYKTFAYLEKRKNEEDKVEKIDNTSTVLHVINEDNKVDFEDLSIIYLDCIFDKIANCLLVKYRYQYTYAYASDLIYSKTFRVLKDGKVKDVINYYPIFKLAVFAGLNNAKREYVETEKYDKEIDAIKEEINKSFLVTYAHIQVFKEIKK